MYKESNSFGFTNSEETRGSKHVKVKFSFGDISKLRGYWTRVECTLVPI